MFSLYHNKNNFEIKIAPCKFGDIKRYNTGKIEYYNENYFMCSDRNLLKDKAEEIRQAWIRDTEEKLVKFKEVKIKNKYK